MHFMSLSCANNYDYSVTISNATNTSVFLHEFQVAKSASKGAMLMAGGYVLTGEKEATNMDYRSEPLKTVNIQWDNLISKKISSHKVELNYPFKFFTGKIFPDIHFVINPNKDSVNVIYSAKDPVSDKKLYIDSSGKNK